jgi:hypothetical protein
MATMGSSTLPPPRTVRAMVSVKRRSRVSRGPCSCVPYVLSTMTAGDEVKCGSSRVFEFKRCVTLLGYSHGDAATTARRTCCCNVCHNTYLLTPSNDRWCLVWQAVLALTARCKRHYVIRNNSSVCSSSQHCHLAMLHLHMQSDNSRSLPIPMCGVTGGMSAAGRCLSVTLL